MTVVKGTTGYTATQIAALFILQIVIGEDVKPAYRALLQGSSPATDDLFNANIHVYVGLLVTLLAVWRLAILLINDVPAPP